MTGIVLLAAGESSRLGRPKQLVTWEGEPLLRRMARAAIQADLGGPVVIVLGAVDEPCRNALLGLDLTIVHNSDWQSGMGGSIAAGVEGMPCGLDGVLLMLCDQPHVTSDFLRSLASADPDSRIVASRYDDHLGPPAWFSSRMISDLLDLKGSQQGAKNLIEKDECVRWRDWPEGAFDIDLPSDLLLIPTAPGGFAGADQSGSAP